MGHAGRDADLDEPAGQRAWQRAGQAGDHQREHHADRHGGARVLERRAHAGRRAPVAAGTEPMMEEEFGEANIPLPIPFSAMNSANAQ